MLTYCKHVGPWEGKCSNTTTNENGFCNYHQYAAKCHCGKPAVEWCGHAGSLVCGQGTCGHKDCKCKH